MAAEESIKKIGYNEEYQVMIKVNKQSSEINFAVTSHESDGEIGVGDQRIMFGYACAESDGYILAPIYYAHKLS